VTSPLSRNATEGDANTEREESDWEEMAKCRERRQVITAKEIRKG